MVKVSALISAYYAKDFLDARIQNLFGQKKNLDLEIVVVCQDKSIEDKIASGYEVQVIRTPGIPRIGTAWNLAIRKAKGEYLTTANSDDRFKIGGLVRMAETLDKHPDIDLVFSQVDVDDGQEVVPWKRVSFPTGEVQDIKRTLQARCIIGPMPLWRAEVNRRLGYFDETLTVASDYEFWLRMARGGLRFFYIAESLGVYARRPDSLEHRHPLECRQESNQVRAKCA